MTDMTTQRCVDAILDAFLATMEDHNEKGGSVKPALEIYTDQNTANPINQVAASNVEDERNDALFR